MSSRHMRLTYILLAVLLLLTAALAPATGGTSLLGSALAGGTGNYLSAMLGGSGGWTTV